MNEPKWYVLKVASGQEKKVKAYLESELAHQNMQDCIKEILIPTEKVYEMRAGKKKVRERNFYPGYILLHTDFSDGRTSHLVKSVPGALGFLSARGWGMAKDPVPLRQEEVNKILGRVGDVPANEELILENPFSVGESVKIVDGPFNGFSGEIQEIFEDRKRINVEIKIFERNTPVELNYIQVEKIA